MKFIRFLFLILIVSAAADSWARPLLTEEVAPIGFLSFEGTGYISYRRDEFKSPDSVYETTNFPARLRFGAHPKADIGLDVSYIAHQLRVGSGEFNGSSPAELAPLFKISPWQNFGVKGVWHIHQSEDTEAELPIGHGDDFELVALFKIPIPYASLHLNTGYYWKEAYHSQFGVRGGAKHKVEMGNIFESRASLEVPVKWNFNLLTELAYYQVGEEKIDSLKIPDSKGTAMDALAGLTWMYGGWNIGAGVSFGLLDEQHSSFDLTHGSGDWQTHLTLGYKISPKDRLK